VVFGRCGCGGELRVELGLRTMVVQHDHGDGVHPTLRAAYGRGSHRHC